MDVIRDSYCDNTLIEFTLLSKINFKFNVSPFSFFHDINKKINIFQ